MKVNEARMVWVIVMDLINRQISMKEAYNKLMEMADE